MVSEKDVSYVADLAHLELTEEERARMLKDLNSILGYIDRLNELDTSNVEPMAQVASRYGERRVKTRPTRSPTRCAPTNRVLACRTTKPCGMRLQPTEHFSRCRR